MRLVVALYVVEGLALLGCAANSPDGDWVFKGPECPGAYPNCQNARIQSPSMFLYPGSPPPPEGIWRPWMEITCWEDGPLVMLFTAELAFFKAGTGAAQFIVEGGDRYGPYTAATFDGRGILFGLPDAAEIVALMAKADEAGRDVDVELHSDGDRDPYSYAVAGFKHNYQRLSCSGQ